MPDYLSTDVSKSAVQAYLMTLAPASQKRMLGALRLALRYLAPNLVDPDPFTFPWAEVVSPDTLEKLVGILKIEYPNGPSPSLATIAIKQILKRLARSGELSAETWIQISLVKSPRSGSRSASEMYRLSRQDIVALAEICAADLSPTGSRDAAIFAIAISTGCRVSELSGLNLSDVCFHSGDISVRKGKGGFSRRVRISGNAKVVVEDWVNRWRGHKPGSLFVPISRCSKVASGDLFSAPRRLGSGPIAKRLRIRTEEAGISNEIQFHTFRRNFATTAFLKGIDPTSIQRIMGHKSATTTFGYSQVSTEEALGVIGGISPYPRV